MATETIKSEVLRALQTRFGGDPRVTDSLAAIGVDSLGMAELTCELENHFGIRMDEEILDVETVGELADYVESKAAVSAR